MLLTQKEYEKRRDTVAQLETPRMRLRPFQLEDKEDLFAIAGNPKVAHHLTYEPHASVEESQRVIREFFISCKEAYALEHKESGRMIGVFDYRPDLANSKFGFGYMVGEAYWGQGYMTEALSAVIHMLFTVMEAHRVESQHYPENPASGRVMEKCGMVREGVQREAALVKGTFRDLVQYGLLRQDYLQK